MRTWERYFIKRIVGGALLFLLVFYGLYVLIDYASHLSGVNYHHSRLKPLEFIVHYASEFSLKADLLLPFALLISTIHTLTKLNTHSELVSLLASGHSLHRLMRPFLLIGLCSVALLYANNEWIVPAAAHRMESLDKKYKTKRLKESRRIAAHSLRLQDGSELIYREFDSSLKKFYEVYWIGSIDRIYRMEELDPFALPPIGKWVDIFERDPQGVLQAMASQQDMQLIGLKFDEKTLHDILLEPEDLPISSLMQEAPDEESARESEKAARHLTALYRKLLLPWLALIAVIAPAPFCLRFGRNLPVLLIFAGGIFGLAALYLLFDAATVLGERQVLSPAEALGIPAAFFIFLFLYRFIRMRT